jgi:predicted glycosyltransferase
VAGAAAVVSMGGYNSVCELLSAGRPTLVVPRTTPRREQLVRAEGLAPHTALDHVLPEHATPAVLAAWLDRAVRRAATPHDLDLDGLGRLARLVDDLLAPTLAEETSRATA